MSETEKKDFTEVELHKHYYGMNKGIIYCMKCGEVDLHSTIHYVSWFKILKYKLIRKDIP